ncbi:DUF58 domain-containing protein [Crateriforma conspicua]|uniref:DUF58 domain-containing protein n=1 Tax=Crateriforma conspicua TaxID=2527996 RepID=A0A5C5Y365_9PLAN|nr:DUF58 domain-containing protein [Crateriforma conspicua]QDV64809.1 hypothetical protein Mal65_39730 [Crateriforma conspicua]TWT70206.1 hypothetical protein Pan14r_25070 [Crateriforma conspicua]
MIPQAQHRDFLDPQMLVRLSSIPLYSRQAMLGNVSGMHASPHRGSSVEFAEYRRYVPGDDLRRLDWRAYGRSDRFYVKEFEADTNLRCHLILDTSGSMGYGSTAATKLSFARRIIATLAHLAIQQGDAAGLTGIGETITETLPPRRTPSHLRVMFDVLQNIRPGGGTQLVQRIHEFADTTRQRALVVIVSDLFVEPAELRGAIDHLRFCKHDVAAFHLIDREEIDFTFSRPTRFVDMESDEHVFADPNDIAPQYHRAMSEYLTSIRQMMLESAVDYHRVITDQDVEIVLRRFLVGRAGGRQAVAETSPIDSSSVGGVG